MAALTTQLNQPSNSSITTSHATSNLGSISRLPTEIILHILQSLPYYALKNFSWSSKECKVFVSNIWKLIFMRDFPGVNPQSENYERNFIIHTNFNKGIGYHSFIDTPNPRGTEKIVCQNFLLTAHRCTIQVWDLKTLQLKYELKSSSPICCLSTYKNMPVSASYDGTIRVWDLASQTTKFVLNPMTETTCLVSNHGQYIFSGDSRGRVMAWDVEKSSSEIALKSESSISSLFFDHPRLIVGDITGKISILDLAQGVNSHIQGHTSGIYDFAIDNKDIYSSANDTTIKIWDRHQFNFVGTIPDSQTLTPATAVPQQALQYKYNHIQIFEGKLFANLFQENPERRELCSWDLKTKINTPLPFIKTNGVSSFLIHNGKLIVDYIKGYGIQICDFAVPEHQIKYPQLAHLSIETPQDYEQTFGCDPEEIIRLITKTPTLQNLSSLDMLKTEITSLRQKEQN